MTYPANRKTVLVVEDDERTYTNMLLTLKETLERRQIDVEVLHVVSLRDAHTSFEKHAPIAISTDMQIPIFSERVSRIEQYGGIEFILHLYYEDKNFDTGKVLLYTSLIEAEVEDALEKYRFKLQHVLQKRPEYSHAIWAEKFADMIAIELAKP